MMNDEKLGKKIEKNSLLAAMVEVRCVCAFSRRLVRVWV
jgi:hypothetical protein